MMMKTEITYSGCLINAQIDKLVYFKAQENALIVGNLLSKHYGNLWAIRKRKFNILHPFRLRYYLVFDVISDERKLNKTQIQNILNNLRK